MFFWGIAFISGRVLSQNYHPFCIAYIRFLLASIILLSIMYGKNKNFYKISGIQFLKVLVLGLTGVFSYNYFFFSGLKLIEAGRASIIVASNPIFTTTIAILFLNESFNFKKMLGVIIAIIGALIVISKGKFELLIDGSIGRGELYLLLAVFSWVIYTIFGKLVLKKITPLESSGWASVIGSFILLPFAYNNGLGDMFLNLDFTGWMHIANLGILSTCFGFIWYYDAVNKIGAAQTSSFINLIPIFGISAGIIFLDEKMSTSLLIGAIIVIFGVFLINKSKVKA